MLIIVVIYFILSILVRYWESTGATKTVRRDTALCFCIFAVVLLVIHFIICIIAEIVVSRAFIKANFPCLDYDYKDFASGKDFKAEDCINKDKDFKSGAITVLEYFLAYLTFSYLELALIGKGALWILIRIKMESGTVRVVRPVVKPSQPVIMAQPAVVMVQQPGQVYYPVQYQQVNPYAYNQQVISNPTFQGQNSNEYKLNEKQ